MGGGKGKGGGKERNKRSAKPNGRAEGPGWSGERVAGEGKE